MFSPSQDDVRRFFCQVMERSRLGEPMDALQTLAAQWINEHPEFHDILSDPAWALKQTYPVEAGHANPFLHLSEGVGRGLVAPRLPAARLLPP